VCKWSCSICRSAEACTGTHTFFFPAMRLMALSSSESHDGAADCNGAGRQVSCALACTCCKLRQARCGLLVVILGRASATFQLAVSNWPFESNARVSHSHSCYLRLLCNPVAAMGRTAPSPPTCTF
jgi:hypothetical protein